jgi:GMP synthase - Glutamine amidotransferase domain
MKSSFKRKECLLVIDFGSQVTQLIARRLRELNVYCEIHPFQKIKLNLLKKISPLAIILSGGPKSVLDNNSPKISKKIYSLKYTNLRYLLWSAIYG